MASAGVFGRFPCIARLRAGTDPRTERLHPEWPVRPFRAAPAGAPQHPGQFIPISTAILIKSEWFLAPNFCLSRDVVLATVL